MSSRCQGDLYQAARVIDVVLLGPVMIGAGRKIGGRAGTFLTISGALTIIFNGITFMDIERNK